MSIIYHLHYEVKQPDGTMRIDRIELPEGVSYAAVQRLGLPAGTPFGGTRNTEYRPDPVPSSGYWSDDGYWITDYGLDY